MIVGKPVPMLILSEQVVRLRPDNRAIHPPIIPAAMPSIFIRILRRDLFVDIDAPTRLVIRIHVSARNLRRTRKHFAQLIGEQILFLDAGVVSSTRSSVRMLIGVPDRRRRSRDHATRSECRTSRTSPAPSRARAQPADSRDRRQLWMKSIQRFTPPAAAIRCDSKPARPPPAESGASVADSLEPRHVFRRQRVLQVK